MFDNLRLELKKKNILFYQVAEILELPRSGITDRFSGKTDWKRKEINEILKLIDCEYREIFL